MSSGTRTISDINGTGPGKVAFVDTESQTETTVAVLAINDPSRLMFTVPNTLSAGTYRLRIETSFSSGSSLLKSVREIEYEKPLTVAAAGGESGSGE